MCVNRAYLSFTIATTSQLRFNSTQRPRHHQLRWRRPFRLCFLFSSLHHRIKMEMRSFCVCVWVSANGVCEHSAHHKYVQIEKHVQLHGDKWAHVRAHSTSATQFTFVFFFPLVMNSMITICSFHSLSYVTGYSPSVLSASTYHYIIHHYKLNEKCSSKRKIAHFPFRFLIAPVRLTWLHESHDYDDCETQQECEGDLGSHEHALLVFCYVFVELNRWTILVLMQTIFTSVCPIGQVFCQFPTRYRPAVP